MRKNSFEWIKLDNAGKIFPGQNMRRWSNVFRLGIELKEEIDPVILKEAMGATLCRIPSLCVRMRKGFFWNYFEKNELPCPVNHDIRNHCYRIDFRENNGYLFRVFYHGKCISIDFYHALCDGYGGVVFLSTLTAQYLRLKGERLPLTALSLIQMKKSQRKSWRMLTENMRLQKRNTPRKKREFITKRERFFLYIYVTILSVLCLLKNSVN